MHVLTSQTKLLEFIGKRKDSRLEIHISVAIVANFSILLLWLLLIKLELRLYSIIVQTFCISKFLYYLSLLNKLFVSNYTEDKESLWLTLNSLAFVWRIGRMN
mgnify:FL=1